MSGHIANICHEVEGWQLLELCEKEFYMKDAAKPIAGVFKKLLTIMSKAGTSAENLGIVVHASQGSSSGPSSSSVPKLNCLRLRMQHLHLNN